MSAGSRERLKTIASMALISTSRNKLVCLLAIALPLIGEKVHLAPSLIAPVATGVVDVGRDKNGNTTLDLHVEHLARAAELAPSKETYVVWVEAPGRAPENIGELKVNENLEGDFKSATVLRHFQLVIRAEDDPDATSPGGPVVLSANVEQ